ncbi:MAG: hypothetical protein HRU31_12375 [Rhodobacteraceae bacterium]|nr:hypothetical protein [Paracoccaceae bacterium]
MILQSTVIVWENASGFTRMQDTIKEAQQRFADMLIAFNASDVDKRQTYQRYLSFQYHLTRGVQQYFMRIAASDKLARKRKLRKFFYDFANEEELHYLVAGSDLAALKMKVLPQPFEVALWHSYFDRVTDERPFLRVGAAIVLENISDGVARPHVKQALSSDFLDRGNTKFLVLHQHETLPHGDQLIEAITQADLSDADIDDLCLGAQQGMVMYLRMAQWALSPDPADNLGANVYAPARAVDEAEIDRFTMRDLAAVEDS